MIEGSAANMVAIEHPARPAWQWTPSRYLRPTLSRKLTEGESVLEEANVAGPVGPGGL
jgi:hypothetical protein